MKSPDSVWRLARYSMRSCSGCRSIRALESVTWKVEAGGRGEAQGSVTRGVDLEGGGGPAETWD